MAVIRAKSIDALFSRHTSPKDRAATLAKLGISETARQPRTRSTRPTKISPPPLESLARAFAWAFLAVAGLIAVVGLIGTWVGR
jgi:hypothetical protein